ATPGIVNHRCVRSSVGELVYRILSRRVKVRWSDHLRLHQEAVPGLYLKELWLREAVLSELCYVIGINNADIAAVILLQSHLRGSCGVAPGVDIQRKALIEPRSVSSFRAGEPQHTGAIQVDTVHVDTDRAAFGT